MNVKHLREMLCGGLLGIIGFLPINQIQAETTTSEYPPAHDDQSLADRGGGGHGGGGHMGGGDHMGGDHGWSGGGHNWDGGGYHDGHYDRGYYGGGYYGGPAVGVDLGGVGVSTGYQDYPYYDGYSYSTTPNVYIDGGSYGGGYGTYGHDGYHGSDYRGWHGDDYRGWQGGSRGTSERTAPGTGYNRGGGGMRR